MVKGHGNGLTGADELAEANKLKDEELESVTGGTANDGNNGAGIGGGSQGSGGIIIINGERQ